VVQQSAIFDIAVAAREVQWGVVAMVSRVFRRLTSGGQPCLILVQGFSTLVFLSRILNRAVAERHTLLLFSIPDVLSLRCASRRRAEVFNNLLGVEGE